MTLVEVYLINNDMENFKQATTRMAQQLQASSQNDVFRNLIRYFFFESKRRECAYNFRLHLVKIFVECGLFDVKIIVNWECYSISRLRSRCIDIPLSAPTMLLELCHEARTVSRDDFDSAFELCVSACNVRDYTSIIQPTTVYVRRLFSVALDNHTDKFYPAYHGFSAYTYHLQKGYYADVSDAVRRLLQSRL